MLAINVGSSSLKFALFEAGAALRRVAEGRIERIGLSPSRFVASVAGEAPERREGAIADAAEAFGAALDWIAPRLEGRTLAAVGHRIVHGGPDHIEHELATPGVIAALRGMSGYDPEHLPEELSVIEAAAARLPGVAQIACFDTGFHRTLPLNARLLPLPRRYAETGLRRYGFHGLAYESVMRELRRAPSSPASRGCVILAHLGSGASLAAVRDGRCIETTMGFSPTSGIPMGTRSGDIDPGAIRRLARADGLSLDDIFRMLNKESGLLGVSGVSADMADLLAAKSADPRAAEAIDWFCYHVRKAIGALAAALGGVDALVFSGGIGERAPTIRARIVDGLGFLGLSLDARRNAEGGGIISPEGAHASVRVIPADEESVIAEAAARIVSGTTEMEAKP